jgi:transcriptional regulator with XRE-family HTH domain
VQTARGQLFVERVAANTVRLRKAKAWTQEALAEAADLAPRSIQRLERAAQDVSLSVLVAVADALGVSPDALFEPARLAAAKPGRPKKAKPGAPRR